MAKKKIVEVEAVPEVVTKEQIEKMRADLAAQKKTDEDAAAVAKAAQDALDAEAVALEEASPRVVVTCEVCGKQASLPAGTDTKNPAKAIKESGLPLPMLGGCKDKPTKCLLEQARAL